MSTYLDNNTVTADAVLTKKGREKLAQGGAGFQITKFALSDTEVDYRLFDTSNSLGSSYYGNGIENMSLIQASPNGAGTLRHKLISLPKNSQRLPSIAVVGGTTSYRIESNATNPLIIQMETFNPVGGNSILGYSAEITNGAVLKIEGVGKIARGGTNHATSLGIQTFLEKKTVTAVGMEFHITPVPQYNQQRTAQIMITGNETGGYIEISVTVDSVKVNVPTII